MAITPRRALILSIVLVLVAATIVAIVLTTVGRNDTTSTTKKGGDTTKAKDTKGKARTPSSHGHSVRSPSMDASGSSSLDDEIEEETTDPTTEVYAVSALAIGDWGRTVAKDNGSCCQRRKQYSVLDYNAMEYTASLLGLAAAQLTPRPSVIIGHGDNFYWTGLQSASDQVYRFMETFETKYADVSLQGIPWINVVGNHDYGGASFVCANGDVPAKCGSTSELLASLQQKFDLQSQYVSPQDNRWHMPARFFVHKLQSPGIDVEIYNTDTNDAQAHGARQICCQCYGYAEGDDSACEDVSRGHSYCAGGDTHMFDACMQQLKAWAMESRTQLVEAASGSNATWKIVNTHYSPYNHYGPEETEAWRALLKPLGINVFFYGHTHGEKHDYSKPLRTHFIENGAGGGIQNESPSGIPPYAKDFVENVWAAGHYPYGIFALRLSPTWAQVQFLTFDEKWVMQKDLAASAVGGIAIKHCWYIPRHGGRGRRCVTDSDDA